MGHLTTEFYKKRVFFQLQEKSKAKNPEWKKQDVRYVEIMLEWLDAKNAEYNLRAIKQIRQKHYDAFMESLSTLKDNGEAKTGMETQRKYALSIRKFALVEKLPLKINPASAKKRKLEKRLARIKKVLMEEGIKGDLLDHLSRKLNQL